MCDAPSPTGDDAGREDKLLATLQAKAALQGKALVRTPTGYVLRWGKCRVHCAGLDAIGRLVNVDTKGAR